VLWWVNVVLESLSIRSARASRQTSNNGQESRKGHELELFVHSFRKIGPSMASTTSKTEISLVVFAKETPPRAPRDVLISPARES